MVTEETDVCAPVGLCDVDAYNIFYNNTKIEFQYKQYKAILTKTQH